MKQKLKQALEHKLQALADDELVLAHRNSEWTGHSPILEEDIAFSNIAQDELGHAGSWLMLLSNLNGADPDRLVYFRDADAYRNVQMVELPKGDWAFSMLRQYLFDAYEMVVLSRLLESGYTPLAEVAAKIRPEELYHYRHTSHWIKRLGLGTEESHRRTQSALDTLWPLAKQLFVALPDEPLLIEAGYVPDPAVLHSAWEEIVVPFLENAGLTLPTGQPITAVDRSQHSEYLVSLLAELQEVARLDPQAEW